MKNPKESYKEVVTLEREGYVARVYIPNLTEEERARRMKKLEKSSARLLAEYLQKNKEIEAQ